MSDPPLSEQGRDLGHDLVQHLVALHLRAHHPGYPPGPLSLPDTAHARGIGRAIPLDPGGPDDHPLATARQSVPSGAGRRPPAAAPLLTLSAHYFPDELRPRRRDAHEAAQRLFPVLALLAQALALPVVQRRCSGAPGARVSADGRRRLRGSSSIISAELSPAPRKVPPTRRHQSRWISPPTSRPSYLGSFFCSCSQDSRVRMALLEVCTRFAVAALVSSAKHPGDARGLVITPLGEVGWSEVRSGWRLSQSSGQVPAVVLGPGGSAESRPTRRSPPQRRGS